MLAILVEPAIQCIELPQVPQQKAVEYREAYEITALVEVAEQPAQPGHPLRNRAVTVDTHALQLAQPFALEAVLLYHLEEAGVVRQGGQSAIELLLQAGHPLGQRTGHGQQGDKGPHNHTAGYRTGQPQNDQYQIEDGNGENQTVHQPPRAESGQRGQLLERTTVGRALARAGAPRLEVDAQVGATAQLLDCRLPPANGVGREVGAQHRAGQCLAPHRRSTAIEVGKKRF